MQWHISTLGCCHFSSQRQFNSVRVMLLHSTWEGIWIPWPFLFKTSSMGSPFRLCSNYHGMVILKNLGYFHITHLKIQSTVNVFLNLKNILHSISFACFLHVYVCVSPLIRTDVLYLTYCRQAINCMKAKTFSISFPVQPLVTRWYGIADGLFQAVLPKRICIFKNLNPGYWFCMFTN
jgi:hypothetical protein